MTMMMMKRKRMKMRMRMMVMMIDVKHIFTRAITIRNSCYKCII